jgi:arginine/lysine/ornithine decarboxylase
LELEPHKKKHRNLMLDGADALYQLNSAAEEAAQSGGVELEELSERLEERFAFLRLTSHEAASHSARTGYITK